MVLDYKSITTKDRGILYYNIDRSRVIAGFKRNILSFI
jgi:hypothetical protein